MQIEYVFKLLDTVSEYPRLGITIPLPVEFSSARWYGNGPHECYSDRCFSALKGMYEMPLEELEVEYIVPQENGGRCGVKYLELKQGSGSDGKILHIQSLEDFAFTVSKYSIKNQLENTIITDTAITEVYKFINNSNTLIINIKIVGNTNYTISNNSSMYADVIINIDNHCFNSFYECEDYLFECICKLHTK